MPRAGRRWLHVIINTRCSWLPGDPRGFRNREHRIHSSGDYKHPPPTGEHQGLYLYNRAHSGSMVRLPMELRSVIGAALLKSISADDARVLVISVSGLHAHMLVELPVDQVLQRAVVGRAKNQASRVVTYELPGSIWSRGATLKPVRNPAHHREVFTYIRDQQGEGAWVWCYRDPPPGT